MKNPKRWMGVLLLLAGLAIFLSPDLYTFWLRSSTDQRIAAFQTEHEKGQAVQADSSESPTLPYEELHSQAQAYNQKLFQENQSEMTDAWAFEQQHFQLELENAMFGYIQIPAMEVTLPLFLGASTENMAKGAVVLGETSLPIGGENTNSVIAGHRGYQGAPYFREIERLQMGDKVFVTNPWETLVYQVVSFSVIQPNDSEAIRIQPGKDMVTLMTCHPYRGHGKYRYLVYCQRMQNTLEKPEISERPSTVQTETSSTSEAVLFSSSQDEIQREKVFRYLGAIIILMLLFMTLRSTRTHPSGS